MIVQKEKEEGIIERSLGEGGETSSPTRAPATGSSRRLRAGICSVIVLTTAGTGSSPRILKQSMHQTTNKCSTVGTWVYGCGRSDLLRRSRWSGDAAIGGGRRAWR